MSLALPPFVHEPATIAAAKAGLHVFCEKPMARTATEARNMRDACAAAGVKLAYQSGSTCLDPTSYAMRDYITSGKTRRCLTTADLPVTVSEADPMWTCLATADGSLNSKSIAAAAPYTIPGVYDHKPFPLSTRLTATCHHQWYRLSGDAA